MSSRVTTTMLVLAALDTSAAVGTMHKDLIKGVSYGPIPLRSTEGASEVPADDWFCDEAVTMWGEAGRGDLKIMRDLGANMVRLYGNNPENDHTNFLDEAALQGLSVAPGLSDFPYYQMTPGSCRASTNFNCFSQVKPLYAQMLQKGFLTVDRRYHAALKYMNIINEPDLKMPSDADTAGVDSVYEMCRTIISAFDAMLDAEKDAGVTGPLINFTATFSFAICSSCEFSHGTPALAQMAQLDDAMRHPQRYGYAPKHDIAAAYEQRFTHSFNTANPAKDVKVQFLDPYELAFPETPVFIAEYHRVGANQTEDLDLIMHIAMASPVFLGISFFQYQVAYWKEGSEREFGMFGLGDFEVGSMPYFSKTYPIYCLTEVNSSASGTTLPKALAGVYGGPGVDTSTLCAANPLGVSLDQVGYMKIALQRSVPQMTVFVQRLIHQLGAVAVQENVEALQKLAKRYSTDLSGHAFSALASYLGSRPEWLDFTTEARCVADRNAHPEVVGAAIGWACSQVVVACDDIPLICNSSTYRIGDYVFSRYFKEKGDPRNPLVSCTFSGAAIFAPSQIYDEWNGADLCVVDGVTTSAPATTSSGYTQAATTGAAITSSPSTSRNHDVVTTSGPSTSRAHDVDTSGPSTSRGHDVETTDTTSSKQFLSASTRQSLSALAVLAFLVTVKVA